MNLQGWLEYVSNCIKEGQEEIIVCLDGLVEKFNIEDMEVELAGETPTGTVFRVNAIKLYIHLKQKEKRLNEEKLD